MKNIFRISTLMAPIAIAAPAFAHASAHDHGVVQTIVHWATQPSHGLALIAASIIIVGGVLYSRRNRA